MGKTGPGDFSTTLGNDNVSRLLDHLWTSNKVDLEAPTFDSTIIIKNENNHNWIYPENVVKNTIFLLYNFFLTVCIRTIINKNYFLRGLNMVKKKHVTQIVLIKHDCVTQMKHTGDLVILNSSKKFLATCRSQDISETTI